MRVINIHKRKLNQPKEKVVTLFKTLATKDDAIWPNKKWPAMRFKEGLKVGSKGGHGRIRYTIIDFREGEFIKFEFTKPEGFDGTHELLIHELSDSQTEISHKIVMNTSSLKATFLWFTVVRWLHDGLIEDAFDKVENHFSEKGKSRRHSLWVIILREFYKRKSKKVKLQFN